MEILRIVIIISGTFLICGIFIVLIKKFLSKYVKCTIEINNDKKLFVNTGITLLQNLFDNDIFIPSACGGNAKCGLCKVKVNSNIGHISQVEIPHLSKEEINNGIRLACQVKVMSNIKIQIPKELYAISKYKTIIKKIIPLTYDIKLFKLIIDEGDKISFKAGQYVKIQSNPYIGSKESVFRSYSIASVPSIKDSIELIIRLVPGGICTTYMHKYVKEGDQILFTGPYGDSFLSNGLDDIILIAGSSGLAPVKSILYDLIEKKFDKNITLFFGVVTKNDLYYQDIFGEMEKKHTNFHFIPALSAPLPKDNWNGEVGLITDIVKKHILKDKIYQAYLCGNPNMIDACIHILKENGFEDDSIFYDKF